MLARSLPEAAGALLWSWSGLDPSGCKGMVGKSDDDVTKSSHPTFGFNQLTAMSMDQDGAAGHCDLASLVERLTLESRGKKGRGVRRSLPACKKNVRSAQGRDLQLVQSSCRRFPDPTSMGSGKRSKRYPTLRTVTILEPSAPSFFLKCRTCTSRVRDSIPDRLR